MAAEWKDSYQGDLSLWWFWQLCFCSIWGRCPAERGEQTLRCAQLSAQLSARLCSLDWSCFHTTLRCTESIHFLWSLNRKFSGLLAVFSSLRSSLLLVHIFLPNFFLPVNFAFNMLWYSTPWTATPFSNDPLWLTLFVEVSMIVFWTIAKSAVFPIIVVSKNKCYPEFILYGW